MNNIEWLLDCAYYPIRYNLFLLNNDSRKDEIEGKLLECPEVQYWMGYLKKNHGQQSVGDIHGSHDYRYENFMGKLTQLGMRSHIEPFHGYASLYLTFLHRQIDQPRSEGLSFGKIYSYRDFETIIAAYLALAGYASDQAVQYVADKRIRLLYEFTKEKRYDIYVDGSKYQGVKKEWQQFLIDPDLYADGNIRLPTVHDYILLGAVNHLGTEQEKVDTIVGWLFEEDYDRINGNYGYFYAPGGSYSTKSICGKFDLPDTKSHGNLVQKLFILSHFRISLKQKLFMDALSYLESFRNDQGRYVFPRELLTEKKDTGWANGGHMGMSEDRKKKISLEVESTYWMERIRNNM